MSTEDRVAAALHALADQTSPPVDGESRLRGRLRREHRLRRGGALLGSVAMVVGIAAVAGTLGSAGGSAGPGPLPFASAASPSPSPSALPPEFEKLRAEKEAAESSPSPSPAPTYPPPAADVGGPSTLITVEAGGAYGFRDARTGRLLVTGKAEGYRVTAVVGAGDGRSFYAASTQGECGSWRIQRVTLRRLADGASATVSDVRGARGDTGAVSSIAVTSDGTKLAYALADGVDPDYGDCMVFRLRVTDLRTGARRTWTGGAMLSHLNWAPDDRTLLFHGQGCCGDYQPGLSRLDTGTSSRTFDAARAVPGTGDFGTDGDNWVASSSASTESEVYAAQESHGDPGAVRIVVLDPVSGRVRRTIATILGESTTDSLSVTRDGRHILLSSGYSDYRIDDGRVSHLPGQHDLRPIAW